MSVNMDAYITQDFILLSCVVDDGLFSDQCVSQLSRGMGFATLKMTNK